MLQSVHVRFRPADILPLQHLVPSLSTGPKPLLRSLTLPQWCIQQCNTQSKPRSYAINQTLPHRVPRIGMQGFLQSTISCRITYTMLAHVFKDGTQISASQQSAHCLGMKQYGKKRLKSKRISGQLSRVRANPGSAGGIMPNVASTDRDHRVIVLQLPPYPLP